MRKFIGRTEELLRLRKLKKKNSASFVAIKGRRRIGKSRLVKEFAKEFDQFFHFSGLAPDENTTHESELEHFCLQLAKAFKAPPAQFNDWSNAFWALGERIPKGRTLVLFDEISWMGTMDPQFLAKIKDLWDDFLKENPKLIFIVCGSASSWIDKNLLNSTGFVGRVSMTLTLEEMPIEDCRQFWPNKNISSHEVLKMLSITGGVPKYLEELNPKLTAEENIKDLCFTKGGFLVDEFDKIFSDFFLRESHFYQKIVTILAKGAKEQKEIQDALKLDTPGRLAEYLSELSLAGFVHRDYTWDIKTTQDSKLSRYRLHDCYLRFYLKYILKNQTKIQRNAFKLRSLSSLPNWEGCMALQFENLVIHNRHLLHKLLNLNENDIITENPYFQRKTTEQAGCQIDYMIQTRFNTLYIIEIKFSNTPIGAGVMKQVQAKMDALKKPRHFSCRPVLVHANEITEQLEEADYFETIINFAELIK